MPISGLIITLDPDPTLVDRAIAMLASDDAFELGERIDNRVAAVLATDSEPANKQAWIALNSLPGVRFVDVTSVHFEETVSTPTPAGRTPQ